MSNESVNKRYSLPFEIQPKAKLNNYFDMPFRNSEKPQEKGHSKVTLKSKIKVSVNLHESGEGKTQTDSKKTFFEKKRLSDNTFHNESKFKMDDEMMKEIYDKKEKMRKGHNISVTTNNSSLTSSTQSHAHKKSSHYFSNSRKATHSQFN